MDLFIVRGYKERYPGLQGRDLTDRLVADILSQRIPADIRLLREESGRPYIEWNREEKPPYVSVSHCGDVFACIFDDAPIGLDIQDRRSVDTDKIARRYFTEEERAMDFFTVWTRKEALAKYTGRGIALIMAGEKVTGRDDVCFDDLTVLDGIHVCVCRPGRREGGKYEIQLFG